MHVILSRVKQRISNIISRLISIFLLIILFAPVTKSQFIDTLVYSVKKVPMPFFAFESSNSFVGGTSAWITGYKVGITFNGRLSTGYGWYKLVSDIVENKTIVGLSGNDSVVPAQLKMKYKAISLSYVYFKNQKWILSATMQPAWGESYFEYFISAGDREQAFNHKVNMIEIGSGAAYKVFPWIGLGAGLGYRIMTKNNPSIDYNFNTVNYYLGLRVFIDEIYKSVFPEGLKSK